MIERIIRHPITSILGLAFSGLQYVAQSPSGFTWKGFGASLLTLGLGLFSKDK